MADAISIEHVSKTTLAADPIFYNTCSLLNRLMAKYIGIDKDLQVIHIDLTLDSITNALAEVGAPTNAVINFAAPQQVFLRSDAAADTSKKVDVIGQKADGSYGSFTLTSNAVDGTTPVDEGTWNFISWVDKNDAWAGNVILDDDGSSTTVFWTLPLGATPTTGILVVPKGYHGTMLCVDSYLLAAPANVNAADRFEMGDDYGWTLNSFNPNYSSPETKHRHLVTEEQVLLQAVYTGAAETDAQVGLFFVIWED